MTRQPLVIANWKMNGSRELNARLIAGIRQGGVGTEKSQTEVGVCPPMVYLGEVANLLIDSNIHLGAQDVSAESMGAHTGDTAVEMLLDYGCEYVIVGHSERRADHGETNEAVARKFWRALAAGLKPVLCVGETLGQRQAGNTLKVIEEQLAAVFVASKAPSLLVIAYEPVWAIGTGQTASAEQVQEVHAFIRGCLGTNGSSARILYGGSVKPDNAQELFRQPDVDGGLIGGASLEAESFVAICRAADKSQ